MQPDRLVAVPVGPVYGVFSGRLKGDVADRDDVDEVLGSSQSQAPNRAAQGRGDPLAVGGGDPEGQVYAEQERPVSDGHAALTCRHPSRDGRVGVIGGDGVVGLGVHAAAVG